MKTFAEQANAMPYAPTEVRWRYDNVVFVRCVQDERLFVQLLFNLLANPDAEIFSVRRMS